MPELDGTVPAVGVPAEEGGGGKVTVVEHWVFDDALMFHPAGDPERGINALAALIRAFAAIIEENAHLPAGDNVHGIIPDHAEARVAERAAHAVGATAEVRTGDLTHDPFTNNEPLTDRFTAHLARAVVPTGHPLVAITGPDISDHTTEFTATASDVLADARFRDEVSRDFLDATVDSPIGEGP